MSEQKPTNDEQKETTEEVTKEEEEGGLFNGGIICFCFVLLFSNDFRL